MLAFVLECLALPYADKGFAKKRFPINPGKLSECMDRLSLSIDDGLGIDAEIPAELAHVVAASTRRKARSEIRRSLANAVSEGKGQSHALPLVLRAFGLRMPVRFPSMSRTSSYSAFSTGIASQRCEINGFRSSARTPVRME